jgi:hypothetical protein
MHHCKRLAQMMFVVAAAFSPAAFAQEAAPMPEAADATATAPAAADGSGATATPAVEETPTVAASALGTAQRPLYGVGARWRWVTVPGWFLGMFAEKNVPLSTFNCWALEGFWRKHDKDDPNRTWEIVVSVGYQNMSPPDGYWLGRGKDKSVDADLVQAKNFGLITFDAAYVLRQYFSPYFGIHYGAGLGLGVVRGRILRTSATYDPSTNTYTVQSGGNQICDANAKCNEVALAGTQGQKDLGPQQPHRFEETSVPSALPIINLLFGLDFPIPQAKGLEFRLDAGFYDAFFVGLSGGFAFR